MNGIQLRLGRPLLAGTARQWACVLLVGCVVLVAVLGVLFANQTTADGLDHGIDSPIIAWLGHYQGLAAWLASPGSLVPTGALSAAIVVGCLLAGRVNGAMLAATAVPVAAGLNDGLLKHMVHRTYLGVLTYPSGHTAAVSALAATVVVLLVRPQPFRTGPLRTLLAGAACLLVGVVATGVIGLQWHYFTDTVAGAAVGIGTVCGLALLFDLPAVRRPLARVCRPPLTVREHQVQAKARE